MSEERSGKKKKINEDYDAVSIRKLNELTKSFAKQNLHRVPVERLKAVAPEDRIESLYDVHGVFEPVEETPEFVDDKLRRLKSELSISQRENAFKLKGWSTPSFAAFDQATKQNPEFIERELIKFLRADAFDIERAKTRVLKHFETKLLLFGPDVLGRNLRLSDLDEQEREALIRGGFQLLQKRDNRGRAILLHMSEICWPLPIEMVRRLFFWSASIASRDEITQTRGLVVVHYGVNVNPPPYMYPVLRFRGGKVAELLPFMLVRFVAVHGCFNTGISMDSFSLLTHVIESRYLCRILTHYGSNTECRYNLMTFGIGADVLPIDHEDKVDLTYHKIWLDQLATVEGGDIDFPRSPIASRPTKVSSPTSFEPGSLDVRKGRGHEGVNSNANHMLLTMDHGDKVVDLTYHKTSHIERENEGDDPATRRTHIGSCATVESSPTSIVPGPMDVIMGRGLGGKSSRGNQMLKRLLEEYQSEYDSALNFVKANIREQIYVDLRKRGCRFLAPSKTETNPDGSRAWTEVDESEAKARIGHGFRNRRASPARNLSLHSHSTQTSD